MVTALQVCGLVVTHKFPHWARDLQESPALRDTKLLEQFFLARSKVPCMLCGIEIW